MKKGYLLIFFMLCVHAQQHDERVVGALVTVKDRQTWKKIKNQSDIKEKEIVAAYSNFHKDWLYAEVTLIPGSQNSTGLASFAKDGEFYNNFAIDFTKNVKKLLAKDEVSDRCSLFNQE